MVEQDSILSRSRVFSLHTVKAPSKKIDAKGCFVYSRLRLDCQKIIYDEKGLSVESARLKIEAFQGAVLLSELKYIPLSLLEADKEKRSILIARGKKFWDLRGQHLKEFVDGSHADVSLVV